ncbi:zinc transport system substrate-binding protein [Pseudobutyrivibrio sp. UC1225]|uniref:metal ABC transporter substrate-binding protein n=1 Tax=Pseudobutyrivibrio sp. UC1225 TaxID=1798185 RepID=UPI0008EF6207|nr:metal ABC transporter substrate-binding protein [Pseudobutyrivibrio sp. UC1225]SFN66983.1 zinc transport system substrate-binding protein [Pseudobutyrivibrio sp. UC1225]
MKNLISNVFTKRLFTKNRRIMTLLFTAVILAGSVIGCGNAQSSEITEEQVPATSESSEKISVVTTIFPEYDWVKEIVGDNDNVEITMLLDNGVDLHSFQPTAEDIMKVANCDMFIYVGGESDEWVEDALKESVNPDMVVINLLDALGESNLKEEEVVEGMEAEEEEEEGEEEEGPEIDEHVWLSLKNAQTLVKVIAEKLSEIDAPNSQTYSSNADSYIAKLADLDEKYTAAVADASKDTLLFGDRFPFRYLVDDYGLNYYAAFVGCSAETEASFETVAFLSKKVDELDLNTVLTIEKSDGKIANTIIQNTANKDAIVLAMDSMQATTSQDVAGGASYISIMESNLEVLKEALR